LTPDPDDDLYVVTVPALPGCFTQGRTVDEALQRAREAIAGHIAALEDIGESIPEERAHPELARVEV
jgi:predicted RNase H-like HicB family nuclease